MPRAAIRAYIDHHARTVHGISGGEYAELIGDDGRDTAADCGELPNDEDEHPAFTCPFCTGRVVWYADSWQAEGGYYRCTGDCDEQFHEDRTHWKEGEGN